jgi:hypothetical protein
LQPLPLFVTKFQATVRAVFVLLDAALWAGLALGVFVDVASCRLLIRRRRAGRGPSGIPVVALVLYVLRIFVRPDDALDRSRRPWPVVVGALLLAMTFHLMCQVIVPVIVVRRTPPARP